MLGTIKRFIGRVAKKLPRFVVASISRTWKYVVTNGHSIDILLNTLVGGHYRETLSGRMGRAIHRGDCIFCYFICTKILSRFETGHCERVRKEESKFIGRY